MSKKRYPESDKSHLNPKIAWKNLEGVFPEHWKINQLEDVFANFEYGQDWLILLTDEKNQVTGPEFRVQSKVIGQRKSSKKRIGTELKVSTINYLRNLSLPVMLHFVDDDSKIGYWMWLDTWYEEHKSLLQTESEKIPVHISRKSVLDKKGVQKIRSYVLDFHFKSTLLKNADAASRADNHYSFSTHFGTDLIKVAYRLNPLSHPL